MSEDPIGFRAGDVNLFRYVGNNPILKNDPFGLLEWSDVEDAFDNARDAFRDSLEKGRKAVDENIDRIKKYWGEQWKNAEKELDKFNPRKDDDEPNGKFMCQRR